MRIVTARIPDLRLDGISILAGSGPVSGRTLRMQALRYAEALASIGAKVVASRLDNGPEWLALDLALRELDAAHVPLPTFFTPAQVQHAIASSGAQVLVTAAGHPMPAGVDAFGTRALDTSLAMSRLDVQPQALPAGTACITYTSGTTGQPKGVCLSEESMLEVASSLVDATRSLSTRRHLCLMPLSTLLENVSGLYAALLANSDIAVPSLAEIGYTGAAGLDMSRLLACMAKYEPESAIVLPQLLLGLVTAAEQGHRMPSSLRFLAVGGGRVGARLVQRAKAVGLPVYEGYGLTECASVVSLNRPGADRPGSVGRPLLHAKVEIRDGEVFVEGARCLGYLGEAGPPPGPIATGDLGHLDEDGFLHITGRRKNIFITAFGRNVSPEWVESELLQHPLLAQAVVWGEAKPTNVAVLWPRRADASDAEIAGAIAEVNAELPDYARIGGFLRAERPFSVEDGLLTSNGRPRRDAILQRYSNRIAEHYLHGAMNLHDEITT
ncbi:AMP-binding protein [Lysobacter soli]|nr:AMP-binding protein [Lysobacter soli]MDG2518395.1 AMP-binding protein [Lysobacter soli]